MVRRIHSILLFALLVGGAGMNYVHAEVYSGTCGAAGNEANVTWELNTEVGTLDINGTGAMTHYWSLTDIPWYNYRQYITRIYVYYGVTAIGHHAFYDCSNVTKISLGNSLTSIGVLSFGFCRKLTSLEIPENVTSIGDQALWYNESLKEVHVEWTGDAVPAMPSNIHNFEASQIRLHIPCGQTAAYVAKGWNTKFALVEGLDVGTIETTTNYFPWVLTCDSVWKVSGTGMLKDFPNPSYVVAAGFRVTVNIFSLSPVFGKSEKVKEAVFEEGITYIGNNTFYKGTYHSGYPYLTTLTLPSTLTSMSSTAFKGCIALKDVYVSWTTAAAIPEWNQSIAVSQATLHVPCGTKSLYQAKSGWQNFIIKEERGHGTCGANGENLIWSLSCDGTLTIQGTGAMADWSSSDKVPWYSYRSSITTVNIRDGVTSVGNRAFIECTALTSVTIPNSVTSISNNAFFSCSALANITIPNNVTTIGQYVFYGCSALTNITIPGSVTSLGENTFRNCSALTDIYVSWIGTDILELPTNIHNSASEIKLHIPCGQTAAYTSKNWSTMFTLNDSSVSGTCGANGDNLTWSLSCDGTLTISGTGEMYNWMSLADRPWHSLCTSIQRVVIEEGVTTTGLHAFYGASNLTSVSLPSTLQTLQFMTFFGCGKLTTLTIPSSVTYVGNRSLEGCSALTDVYMSETGDAVPTMPVGIHTYDASRIRLHIPCGQAGAYFAKGWNTKFTIDGVVSGTCGDNVQWTFESCNGTLSIFGTGPMADYELAQAPWDAYKYSITSVSIAEGVTSIGTYAFYYCTSMTSISLPNSLTSIGNFAFYLCGDLASVIIPNNVTNIGEYAFYYCTSLTSITIPNGVTSIEDLTFYNCTALSSVSIPSSVTSIGYCAFTSCALTSVTIPNSVTSIDYYAFSKCNSLADIYVSWTSSETIPAWQNMTSNDPQSGVTLHVPCAAMSLYQAAEGWKDYTIEGEGGPYTITVESDDPTMGTVDAVKIGE